MSPHEGRGVWLLVVITVAFSLLDFLSGRAVTQAGAKSAAIWAGELHRLVAATFLHGDVIHLLTNIYALWVFGPAVEGLTGTNRFILLYVLSGVIGFTVSLLAEPDVLSVGASAAIFGLLGYMLHYRLRRLPRRWLPTDQLFLQILLINLAVALVVPNIDHWGHIGGALGGALTGSLVGFGDAWRGRRGKGRIETVAAALVIAAVLVTGLRPLAAARAVEHVFPELSRRIEARYSPYFLPFTVRSPVLVWRYADGAGEWTVAGNAVTVDRQRSAVLGLGWLWARGANFTPGDVLAYQVEWRHNGSVVDVHTGRVSRQGYGEHIGPAGRSTALAGDWEVTVRAGGVELVRLKTRVVVE